MIINISWAKKAALAESGAGEADSKLDPSLQSDRAAGKAARLGYSGLCAARACVTGLATRRC